MYLIRQREYSYSTNGAAQLTRSHRSRLSSGHNIDRRPDQCGWNRQRQACLGGWPMRATKCSRGFQLAHSVRITRQRPVPPRLSPSSRCSGACSTALNPLPPARAPNANSVPIYTRTDGRDPNRREQGPYGFVSCLLC